MDDTAPIRAAQAPSEFKTRSRVHGALLSLLITAAEFAAAILTVLLGFVVSVAATLADESPELFEYLEYTLYGLLAAPVTAAVTAVLVARGLRLGVPFCYLIPMSVPVAVAAVTDELTAIWIAPLALVVLGNTALGAAFPVRRNQIRR